MKPGMLTYPCLEICLLTTVDISWISFWTRIEKIPCSAHRLEQIERRSCRFLTSGPAREPGQCKLKIRLQNQSKLMLSSDVADMFPNATVRGVDLFPPPVTWMPPNCVIEVDDILEEWTWREKFDLIHMRNMLGSFDQREWDRVYQQCFE